jgi:hypothetical protein
MAKFASNGDFFRLISDGDKIVLLRENGKQRECYLFTTPLLTSFRINIDRPVCEDSSFGDNRSHLIPGLISCSADLSFRGGEMRLVDKPLIMGVDIFDRLSVTDYLDIINEKIKVR